MLPFADDPRLLVLPAEEVFDLAAVLGVVEDVADGGGVLRGRIMLFVTSQDPGQERDSREMRFGTRVESRDIGSPARPL